MVGLQPDIGDRAFTFERFQIHQPGSQAPASHNVRSSHIVRDAVDPRKQTATAVKRFEAHPQLQVHLLKQISSFIGIGLITAGEPPDGGPVYGVCLRIQCVLRVPIDGSPYLDLASNLDSLPPGQVSYTPTV